MSSNIEGLASWTGVSTIGIDLFASETGAFDRATVNASVKPPLELGGTWSLRVHNSFSLPMSSSDGAFTVSDLASLSTASPEGRAWENHTAVHQMVQDLMSLIFFRPCPAQLKTVRPTTSTGTSQPEWFDALEATFARGDTGRSPLDREKHHPLFGYADVDPQRLATLINGWHLWSRPIWIASTSLWGKHTSELMWLLQVGVAIEALGYSLWRESGRARHPKTPEFHTLEARCR